MSSLGPRVYSGYRRLQRKAFTVLVRGGFRSFGARTAIEPPVKLLGTEHISIGRDTYIGPNCWLTVLGQPAAGDGLVIGASSTIAGDCVFSCALRIVIGDEVVFGRYIHISDHAHRTDDPSLPISRQGITTPKPVHIGAGSWLGQGVVVCPGVTIGRNVTVGANSIVRMDLPDGCLAAGAPAVIKRQP